MVISKKEIVQNWSKIESQLNESKRFLDEDKPDEALYFIWLAAENIVNTLKFSVNGVYLKEHAAKSRELENYFILGTLKNDYSKTFEKLSKYRIVAEFHPYTSIPKDYTKADVIGFLWDITKLRDEVNVILAGTGVLNDN